MSKITPYLWFDNQAIEAAEFYVSAFGNGSKIDRITTLHNTPSGNVDTVEFELLGQPFMAMSAGPLFRFNPSISFFVNFDPLHDDNARDNLNRLWEKLSDGGTVLMPLQEYPFSKWYGWIQDRYGLSWQLILTDPNEEPRPPIIPSLFFVSDSGRVAEEATEFYLDLFGQSRRGIIARYPAGMEPDMEGAIMFTDFMIENQWFAAMDGSSQQHKFGFNEAISLMIACDSQEEVDAYWQALSAVPESEQCGWVKDRYGVSWQIIPQEMNDMLAQGTREQVDRVTQAFLPMKKLILSELQKAYKG